MAVVGGGVGSRGRGGGAVGLLRHSGKFLLAEKRLGMGFSLQGSPGFNIVDIPGLSNKCVVN